MMCNQLTPLFYFLTFYFLFFFIQYFRLESHSSDLFFKSQPSFLFSIGSFKVVEYDVDWRPTTTIYF